MPLDAGYNEPVQVLLVDQDEADAHFISQALKNYWFRPEIHLVENSEQARAFLTNKNGYEFMPTPDLILFGASNGATNAKKLLPAIRQNKRLSDIQVVVLTNSDDHEQTALDDNSGLHKLVRRPDRSLNISRVVDDQINYWIMTQPLPRPH